jgi:GcrA cell cycle regulator
MSKASKTKKPKTVATLEPTDCRWPIGDPRHSDFHFCGAPQLHGRLYCELHWRMSFQPTGSRHQQPTASPPKQRAA